MAHRANRGPCIPWGGMVRWLSALLFDSRRFRLLRGRRDLRGGHDHLVHRHHHRLSRIDPELLKDWHQRLRKLVERRLRWSKPRANSIIGLNNNRQGQRFLDVFGDLLRQQLPSTYARHQPEKGEKTGGNGGKPSHTRLTLPAAIGRENAAIARKRPFSAKLPAREPST